MLPQAPAIPTAWLSPEANSGGQRNAAFLVVNDRSNDAAKDDVTIGSITELISEFFEASGRKRSFASGSAALAANSNGDQRLDAGDARWNDIKLWFDDGDAAREDGELFGIGDVLSSIDLGSLETVSDQPSWAAGNAVRRLSGVNLDDTQQSGAVRHRRRWHRQVKSWTLRSLGPWSSRKTENLEPSSSQAQAAKAGAGQDALTLVRLSGLPDELVPSIGVQDSAVTTCSPGLI